MMNFNVFAEREPAIKWGPCAVSSRAARGADDTDNDENESARFPRTGSATCISLWPMDGGNREEKSECVCV